METFISVDIVESDLILSKAIDLAKNGLKAKDSLHIACAIESGCIYFLTTDDFILKKMSNKNEITVINPIDFIKIIENI